MRPYTSQPLLVSAPQFPERLAACIDDIGKDLRTLAKESGVNKNTISDWRNGDGHAVSVPRVQKLAAVLGTTAEYLLDMPDLRRLKAPVPPPAQLMPDIDRVEDLVRELAGLINEARSLIARK